MTMCPQCGQVMVFKRQDVNREGNVSYDRTVYQCPSEDVWVTIEVAQKKDEPAR